MTQLTSSRRSQIEKVAEKVRAYSRADYLDTNLDDVFTNINNVELVEAEIDDRISGSIHKNENGTYKVIVNARHPLGRKRFTAAHELGHYFLHLLDGEGQEEFIDVSDMYRHLMSYSPAEEERESEANYFAACLLMPETKVRAAWKVLNDVDKIARIFGVSKEAMYFRLKNIDLLNDE
jgi:Zn-dependent peptidase ImmA (M78 family)